MISLSLCPLSLYLCLSLSFSSSSFYSINIYHIIFPFTAIFPFPLCSHISFSLSLYVAEFYLLLYFVSCSHSIWRTQYSTHSALIILFLILLSHGAFLLVSQLWAELGRGCQLQDYDRAPAALCMKVSHWGKNGLQPGTMDGGMEGLIMDGEMEERNTTAICVSPNWRLALAHTSETQGQVTLGDSEPWGCHVRKHRRTLISISFSLLRPSGVPPSERSSKVFCLLFCMQTASHNDQMCVLASRCEVIALYKNL